MYLHADLYVSGYDFRGGDEVARYKGVIEALGMGEIVDDGSPGISITLTLGYWRKANAVHKWFVDNVQDGVDECQKSTVTVEQLTTLRDLCREVLASLKMTEGMVHVGTQLAPEHKEHYEPGEIPRDSRVAREKLPTTSGFFFGGTDYDQWYKDDLEHTVKVCERVINWMENRTESSFSPRVYYQSSW